MRTIRMPYLNPETVDQRLLLQEPTVIRPRDYCVIDGDTFWVLGNLPEGEVGMRPMAFSMRNCSISTPEKVRQTRIEKFFSLMGAASEVTTGDMATRYLKTLMTNRCLLAVPRVDPTSGMVRKDKHQRLLADFYISGKNGPMFEAANARSVSELMLDRGFAVLNPSESRPRSSALDAIAMWQPPRQRTGAMDFSPGF